MVTTVVVEPHALLRLGMLQLLAQAIPSLRLQGVTPDQLKDADPSPVDLVLLSLRTGQDVHASVMDCVKAFAPKWILLLSEAELPPDVLRGLPQVVSGCVATSASADVLAASVRLVLAGGKCFPSPDSSSSAAGLAAVAQPAGKALQKTDDTPLSESARRAAEAEMLRLTPRQYEVLLLLAKGYPIKSVSRELNISMATAKAHAGTLYQRLNVRNKSEAVYAAVARGAKLDWH